MWRIQGLAHALQGKLGLISPGVEHALRGDDRRFIRRMFQGGRQPFLGQLQISRVKRGYCVTMDVIHAHAPLGEAGCFDFQAREVPVSQIQPPQIPGLRLRTRPLGPLVRDASLFQAPDMPTNCGHSVMSSFQIRPPCQNLFQLRDRFDVLEILGRAPQNPGPSQMSLRRSWIERQGALAVIFRLDPPRALINGSHRSSARIAPRVK